MFSSGANPEILPTKSGHRRGRLACLSCTKAAVNRCRNTSVQKPDLLDHLVSAGEQSRRHGKAKRLRGDQVNDQIEFCRLLDWEVGCFRPAQIC